MGPGVHIFYMALSVLRVVTSTSTDKVRVEFAANAPVSIINRLKISLVWVPLFHKFYQMI